LFFGTIRLYYTEFISMRSRALSDVIRVACVTAATMMMMVLGPIGCGEDSGSGTGTMGELPPEAKQANKNMQDFMKNKDATPKK
jgi:hypothetical protein